MSASPEKWAAKVKELHYKWKSDRIVVEKNFGGDMCRAVLHNADPNLPVELVNSAHSKVLRAEPVSVLYEQGRIEHFGEFPGLEEEMLSIKSGDTSDEIRKRLGRSPNALDAAVFALTELFDLNSGPPTIRFLTREELEPAREPEQEENADEHKGPRISSILD